MSVARASGPALQIAPTAQTGPALGMRAAATNQASFCARAWRVGTKRGEAFFGTEQKAQNNVET